MMRAILRWAVRLVGLLVMAALALGLWKRDEIARLMAVNTLFAEDRIVANFSDMGGLFFNAPIPRGDGPASPLPAGAPMTLPEGAADWIAARSVTALVVLKDGMIRHESYHLGTGPEDRRISWSVAKSWLSTLVGILIAEGAIEGLDVPVTRYAPQLAGSAYDGATLRDVLHMASGVAFDEDYLDFWSDINRMGRVLALGGSMDAFAAGQDRRAGAPGETWRYVSIDTHVIGMVIRGATGRSVIELMGEKLVQPLGLDSAPYYVTDVNGVAFVLGGLNMTTRDYARFGQMIAQDGEWQGRRIVPAEWIAAATVPSAPTAPGASQYGLHWWMPADARPGEVYAIGVYGQFIYLDRARGVVIALNSADRGFKGAGVLEGNIAMFRAIAEAVQ